MAGILEDLTNLKTDEEKITSNKVANFAYTNKAYSDNDADGVETYAYANENNIPVANATILQTNDTVLLKGYRAKASPLSRMLVNHFFGRVSYNLNKVNDNFQSLLEKLISSLGTANGLATLDSSGRIPYSQLPESAIEYKGTWDASTNTPTLVNGTGTKGDMYVVSIAGEQDLGGGSIYYKENDRVIYDGASWQKLSGGYVKTVNNVEPDSPTGNVLITGEDIPFDSTSDDSIFTKVNTKSMNLYKTIISPFLGRVWTQSNITFGTFDGGARYANGLWVACSSYNNGIYYSTDGKTWTQSNITSGSFNGGARYGNGIWVACGSNSTGLWYSTDGMNWEQSSQTTEDFEGGARYGNGIWVACSTTYTNGLYYSTDGITWTQSNITSGSFAGGARYANGLWVACSNNYGLYYSTDGITWTQSSQTTGNFYGGARYANGLWVACSAYSNKGIYYSTDGKTWTQSRQTTEDFEGGARYGNGIWVACSAVPYYSTNGKTWTKSNLAFSSEFSFEGGARYANGIWVACSYGSSGTGLYYSLDGINWTCSFINSKSDAHGGARYGNGIWVACVGVPYYSSVDDLIESGDFHLDN